MYDYDQRPEASLSIYLSKDHFHLLTIYYLLHYIPWPGGVLVHPVNDAMIAIANNTLPYFNNAF